MLRAEPPAECTGQPQRVTASIPRWAAKSRPAADTSRSSATKLLELLATISPDHGLNSVRLPAEDVRSIRLRLFVSRPVYVTSPVGRSTVNSIRPSSRQNPVNGY